MTKGHIKISLEMLQTFVLFSRGEQEHITCLTDKQKQTTIPTFSFAPLLFSCQTIGGLIF